MSTTGTPTPEVRYTPIGLVHSPHTSDDLARPTRLHKRDIEGSIEVFPEYIDGLRDLEGFSHVLLLCHLHLSAGFSMVVKHASDMKTHGLFATRSPRRPNPIAVSVVRLRRIEDNLLHVIDIDLVDGTPVLDIKPYVPAIVDGDEVRTGWMDRRPGR
ncbi:MAG: tRNA (N6-threonylcarbamoyladenosine(37)-N6)-methyltransferase TrmO [Dehalococcoidia bacterium]|nr:tRNA (N6-threonylcarbamoyladenosine(37)-N6)-methyltransferase TrmO [Dehalococcoidia bacterium]